MDEARFPSKRVHQNDYGSRGTLRGFRQATGFAKIEKTENDLPRSFFGGLSFPGDTRGRESRAYTFFQGRGTEGEIKVSCSVRKIKKKGRERHERFLLG